MNKTPVKLLETYLFARRPLIYVNNFDFQAVDKNIAEAVESFNANAAIVEFSEADGRTDFRTKIPTGSGGTLADFLKVFISEDFQTDGVRMEAVKIFQIFSNIICQFRHDAHIHPQRVGEFFAHIHHFFVAEQTAHQRMVVGKYQTFDADAPDVFYHLRRRVELKVDGVVFAHVSVHIVNREIGFAGAPELFCQRAGNFPDGSFHICTSSRIRVRLPEHIFCKSAAGNLEYLS